MINSLEVCFDITRQYTQVGHKNINIFSYKNHLGSFCRNGHNLYSKIYFIPLCNFWHRSYSWQEIQHIQNLDTEEL
jgi:hypothetical protein